MIKKIIYAFFFGVIGFGFAYLTMEQKKPSGLGKTVVIPRQMNGKQTDYSNYSLQLHQQRKNKFRRDNTDDKVRPQSLFWQTMALLKHSFDDDFSVDGGSAITDKAIDNLNDDELEVIIRTYTKLSPHDYPQDVDVRDFAKRLGEIYYQSPFEDEAGQVAASEEVGFVEFGRSITRGNVVTAPQVRFNEDTRRIYASFDTSNYDKSSVMVKWSRVDSSEVIIYDKYPINRGYDHNYIWLESPNEWDNGDYQVEIFSLADNLSLLAKGNYQIEISGK